jgi:hypothetical protein
MLLTGVVISFPDFRPMVVSSRVGATPGSSNSFPSVDRNFSLSSRQSDLMRSREVTLSPTLAHTSSGMVSFNTERVSSVAFHSPSVMKAGFSSSSISSFTPFFITPPFSVRSPTALGTAKSLALHVSTSSCAGRRAGAA